MTELFNFNFKTNQIHEFSPDNKGCLAVTFDQAMRLKVMSRVSLPEEISKEDYYHFLGAMLPVDFTGEYGCQSFKLQEKLIGNVTLALVNLEDKYYKFNDFIQHSHMDLIRRLDPNWDTITIKSPYGELNISVYEPIGFSTFPPVGNLITFIDNKIEQVKNFYFYQLELYIDCDRLTINSKTYHNYASSIHLEYGNYRALVCKEKLTEKAYEKLNEYLGSVFNRQIRFDLPHLFLKHKQKCLTDMHQQIKHRINQLQEMENYFITATEKKNEA